MIHYRCPSCRTGLVAAPAEAGTKVSCLECGQRLQVPSRPPRNRTVLGELTDSRRRADEDDYRPRRRRRGFRCPYCGTDEPPDAVRYTSATGYATFVILLFMCFPLCIFGLMMKETYHRCSDCGITLGG
jgi:DNA-directed RNA polymerase subunit RPC12/RpoP